MLHSLNFCEFLDELKQSKLPALNLCFLPTRGITVHSLRLGCRCSYACSRANICFRSAADSVSVPLCGLCLCCRRRLGTAHNQRCALDSSELVDSCRRFSPAFVFSLASEPGATRVGGCFRRYRNAGN